LQRLERFFKDGGVKLPVWAERLKGYAYTEIAAHLGKSPKSIDNAMQRIRKKVLTYMEK